MIGRTARHRDDGESSPSHLSSVRGHARWLAPAFAPRVQGLGREADRVALSAPESRGPPQDARVRGGSQWLVAASSAAARAAPVPGPPSAQRASVRRLGHGAPDGIAVTATERRAPYNGHDPRAGSSRSRRNLVCLQRPGESSYDERAFSRAGIRIALGARIALLSARSLISETPFQPFTP